MLLMIPKETFLPPGWSRRTAGLDPQARHQIWDKVRELKRSGTTVILTTHYMEEASALCDRLAIMDGGRIIERGSSGDLINRYIGSGVIEIDDFTPRIEESLLENGIAHETYAGRIYIYTDNGRELLETISNGTETGNIIMRQSTLEDVFLKLTGRQLRE